MEIIYGFVLYLNEEMQAIPPKIIKVNMAVEYSFISREKFDQIVEQHLSSLSEYTDRSVITNELAAQIIRLIENNSEDDSADRNLVRWSRQFTIRTINGTKILYKKAYRKHHVELRVCTREQMYHTFCRIHSSGCGESHYGLNSTWRFLNQQYCFFPQAISYAACMACSVCYSRRVIR